MSDVDDNDNVTDSKSSLGLPEGGRFTEHSIILV